MFELGSPCPERQHVQGLDDFPESPTKRLGLIL